MPSIEKNTRINAKEVPPASDAVAKENSVNKNISEIENTQEVEPPIPWDSACKL
jgi:hypothetical protein